MVVRHIINQVAQIGRCFCLWIIKYDNEEEDGPMCVRDFKAFLAHLSVYSGMN